MTDRSRNEPIVTKDIARPESSLIEALKGIGSATATGELKRLGIRSAYLQGPVSMTPAAGSRGWT